MRGLTSEQSEIRRRWFAETNALIAKAVEGAWNAEATADPWQVNDLREANAAVSKGLSVATAAGVVVARRMAREIGVAKVRSALGGLC